MAKFSEELFQGFFGVFRKKIKLVRYEYFV
nr:MAG TPA: hypothetical protein [Caudoviricetes sp.]